MHMTDAYFLPSVPPWMLSLIVFGLLVLLNWLGFTYRKREMRASDFTEPTGMNLIENSLLGLTALLLAFTFGMAASKFDTRRQIIVEEANHIGTAVLRCDLYPDSVRNLLRADFKQYVEARISTYEAAMDEQKMKAAMDSTAFYSGRIWKRVAEQAQNPANLVRSNQMVPALNNMIDIVTTRDAARKAMVPRLILLVLILFSMLSAFLSGYGNKSKRRNKVMVGSFAVMTTISLFLIAELDRPDQGFINTDISEETIKDLRTMFQ